MNTAVQPSGHSTGTIAPGSPTQAHAPPAGVTETCSTPRFSASIAKSPGCQPSEGSDHATGPIDPVRAARADSECWPADAAPHAATDATAEAVAKATSIPLMIMEAVNHDDHGSGVQIWHSRFRCRSTFAQIHDITDRIGIHATP